MKDLNSIKSFIRNPLVDKSIKVLFLRIVGVLLFFSLTLFLTNKFDPTIVGQYDFSRSLLIFLGGIGVFGMHQSIIYYSGYLKAHKALHYLKHIYKRMVLILLSISLVFFVLALLVNKEFINSIFEKDVAVLVFKTVSTLFLYGLTLLNIDVFRAIEKTYMSEVYRNVMRYAPFFILILIIFYTGNTHLLVDVFLLNFLFLAIVSTIYLGVYFSKITSDPKSFDISFKSIFKRSGPMAISAITYLLMQSVDVILLSKFSSFEMVAFYSVAIKLTTIISLVLASVNTVYSPTFSELFNSNKLESLRNTIKRSTRLIFVLTSPAILIVFIFADFILNLFGPDYTVAKSALYVLLLGQAVNALCGSVGVYMNMTNKQNVLQKILLVAFALNVALNLLLIPEYGILGAAIATTTSTVLWNIVAAIYIYRKDKVKTFLTL